MRTIHVSHARRAGAGVNTASAALPVAGALALVLPTGAVVAAVLVLNWVVAKRARLARLFGGRCLRTLLGALSVADERTGATPAKVTTNVERSTAASIASSFAHGHVANTCNTELRGTKQRTCRWLSACACRRTWRRTGPTPPLPTISFRTALYCMAASFQAAPARRRRCRPKQPHRLNRNT